MTDKQIPITEEALKLILPNSTPDERKHFLETPGPFHLFCRACGHEDYLESKPEECPRCHSQAL